MDERQKKLLTVCSLLVIGMSGMWFFFWRDSGPQLDARTDVEGPGGQLVRVNDEGEEKPIKIRGGDEPSERPPGGKLIRDGRDDRKGHKLIRTGEPKAKKKKTPPAA